MQMKRITAFLAALLLVALLAASSAAETLTISMVGDCTVGENDKMRGYTSGYTYQIRKKGFDYPFSLVADMFAADDLTIANCEGVLSERSSVKRTKHKDNMWLIADPEFAQVFKLGNVDVCNLANNHGKDFGGKGQENTAASLAAVGIDSFYDKVTLIKEVKGVKIGFVGYTYPFNDNKVKKMVKAMKALREEGCTFVIASCHWGRETYYQLDGNQGYATKLIDAGFDMVYGTGSHTCQMIRWYKGKLIFYSLSNFTFGANAAPKDDDTVVIQVRYDIREDGTLAPAELYALPFKMHKDRDFRPWPIEDEQAKQVVWEKLYYNGYGKTRKAKPAPSLPESFLTTGYVDLRELPAE